MKTLLNDLKKEYRPFNSLRYQHSHQQYQKKISDKKGIKYFLDCALYNRGGIDYFEFHSQFTVDDRTIEIKTVSRTSDPEEEYRTYPTIKEIEKMFKKMRIAYGSGYYELY